MRAQGRIKELAKLKFIWRTEEVQEEFLIVAGLMAATTCYYKYINRNWIVELKMNLLQPNKIFKKGDTKLIFATSVLALAG